MRLRAERWADLIQEGSFILNISEVLMSDVSIGGFPRVELCSEGRTHFWKQHPFLGVHKTKKGINETIDVSWKSRSYYNFSYIIHY